MEEVKELKYLGTVLCKHEEMEGEIREWVAKGRCVIRSLARVVRGSNDRFEKLYSSANRDMDRDLDME